MSDGSKRDHSFPLELLEAFRLAVAGFASLPDHIQHGFGLLIWEEASKRRKHKVFPGYISVPYQELDRLFGPSKFIEINKSVRIFAVTPNWSEARGYTRGMKLLPAAAQIKSDSLRLKRDGPIRFVDLSGKCVGRILGSIAAKDMDGRSVVVWKDVKPPNRVRVDVDSLQTLARRYEEKLVHANPRDDATKKLQQRAVAVASMLVMANTKAAGSGYIVHRYMESRSGRLYAMGLSLQTVPGIVKRAALHGLWEYDFENCHYSIFQQMADAVHCSGSHIAEYLANKKTVRSSLMTKIGLSEKQVKKSLMAIMYGARDSLRKQNAIPKELGVASAKKLFQDDLVKGIFDDIEKGRAALLSTWPDRNRRHAFVNAVGKAIDCTEPAEKILAHLIQGVEVKMLLVAVRMHREHIVLLQHDGFTCSRQLDVHAIEEAMRQKTAFRMQVSEVRLAQPIGL